VTVDTGAAFAAVHKRLRAFGGALSRLLSHPLILILIGGAISALIVPMITQRWQNHQRELDVQAELVSDMTRRTSEHVAAVILADRDALKHRNRRLERARARWIIDSAVVRARLRAYYPGDELVARWERFSDAMFILIGLAECPDVGYPSCDQDSALDLLAELPVDGPVPDARLQPGWFVATESIEQAEDELISRVLTTTPRV
jgi:hypothetical protein